MRGRWWTFILLFFGGLLAVPAPGAPAVSAVDPVAIVTGIKVGQGEVQVKAAAEANWKAPLPLLSLRPGDQIRTMGNASAVLMFTGGRGTVTISATNSPYTVQDPPAGATQGKIQELIANLGKLLMGKKKDLPYIPMVPRGVKQPPLLLSPREGMLLAAPVMEWAGSDRLRYTIRVLGPQGPVWEQGNLHRAPLSYPATAPPLRSGVPYHWELETTGFPAQRGQFTILSPTEVATVQGALTALDPTGLPGYPKNTVILMRAGFLMEQELYTDAAHELQVAIAGDPGEPNLHLMLGNVYERIGLGDLAIEEFDEAQFLTSHVP